MAFDLFCLPNVVDSCSASVRPHLHGNPLTLQAPHQSLRLSHCYLEPNQGEASPSSQRHEGRPSLDKGLSVASWSPLPPKALLEGVEDVAHMEMHSLIHSRSFTWQGCWFDEQPSCRRCGITPGTPHLFLGHLVTAFLSHDSLAYPVLQHPLSYPNHS